MLPFAIWMEAGLYLKKGKILVSIQVIISFTSKLEIIAYTKIILLEKFSHVLSTNYFSHDACITLNYYKLSNAVYSYLLIVRLFKLILPCPSLVTFSLLSSSF